MIGILGGMGTQAGLDFSTKLAKLYRGKLDQKYPLFVLYNKSNVPKRLSDKKIKMYAIDEITFDHFGGQSHDEKYDHEAHLSRNWHYNWSKFYFYNKHNNYLYALRKILPNLAKSIVRYLKNFFINKKKRELYFAEFNGIISSVLKKKSDYRPHKKL